MIFSSLLLAGGLVQLGLAAYSVKDDYSGDKFFDMFSFNTFDDPTHGYVNYVDKATAEAADLFNVSNGVATFGVDHTNVASGRGRTSIRLTSNTQYTHGLIIVDLAHMPGSICGSWPAFWMTGPNWPNSGEIDIIEGVNSASSNQMTMHTSAGCSLANSDCQGNLGCSVKTNLQKTYGTDFNSNGGGVYATEWTSNSINIWFFGHGRYPPDVLGPNPNPGSWGNPTASFVGGSGCDIDQHFINNNIVFDTTFCGDWAGEVFSQDSTCSAVASSCQDYVQNHPEAFAESYWAVNSLKVYTDDGSPVQNNVQVSQPKGSPIAQPVIESSAPQPTQAVEVPKTPTEKPQRTHTHGEVFLSSETGLANLTIAAREADEKPELVQSSPVDADKASEAVQTKVKLGRHAAKHLHRHSHGIHHHS
ncbi:MAG: hypothetical protein LQ342_005790 [Letrouitia transgressa]|nr:MAG: hypothetical protein LQ342_005790 [Letrouitia transgressa]